MFLVPKYQNGRPFLLKIVAISHANKIAQVKGFTVVKIVIECFFNSEGITIKVVFIKAYIINQMTTQSKGCYYGAPKWTLKQGKIMKTEQNIFHLKKHKFWALEIILLSLFKTKKILCFQNHFDCSK